MNAPTVCAVMLANGRPEMVKRAVACWHNQNYAGEKRILIYNNNGDKPICTLRNLANAQTDADIIIHWDSDDWSHPNRIAEQVALLQASGAECVGYGQMLFYSTVRFCDCYKSPGPPWYASRCRKPHGHVGDHEFGTKEEAHERFYSNKPTEIAMIQSELLPGAANFGDAWIYTASIPNYAIGTSMCYWRKTWEAHPFPDRSEGCDDLFWFNEKVKIESISSLMKTREAIEVPPSSDDPRGYKLFIPGSTDNESMMIASVHSGNTCTAIMRNVREWKSVPEWNTYCREAMKL